MSDQQTAVEVTSAPSAQPTDTQPADPATPVVAPAPTQAAQPPATPEPKRVSVNDIPEDALKPRLEAERRKGQEDAYRALGKSESEIKALIEAEQARIDAQKTLEQKLAEREAALEAATKTSATYLEAIKQRAEFEMGSLTESQREAVKRIAGDDGPQQLRAIDALRPTWVSSVASAPSTPATQPAAPVATVAPPPAPIQTAPAPSAPGAGVPAGEVNHRAVWQDLHTKNPVAAAHYARMHPELYRQPQ